MNKKTTITIAAIAIVLIAVVVFVLGNHGGTPQAQPQPQPTQANQNSQTQPVQPSQPVAPAPTGLYTSSADGFSVNFPGTPQVDKTTFNSQSAGSIPLTKYILESGSGSSVKYHLIYVYHYSKTYQFPENYLTDAMRLFAAALGMKYPGTKLVSQSAMQFQGGSAVSGVLSDSTQVPGYLVITVKNQNTYGIGTYGADKASYNAFVNSFTFAQ